MAIVEGTNAGFVTTAPTADPTGTALTSSDALARACKFTAPSGATTITEMGWWCNNATEEANFELGIYNDNGGGATSAPSTLRTGTSRTNAKGTGSGWKVASGLSIAVTAGTAYWLAFQLDNTATTTETDGATGGARRSFDASDGTTLLSTWVDSGSGDNILAIYALYTPTSTSTGNFFAVL